MFDPPRVVSLHYTHVEPTMLYGVDEATGRVIFEIGGDDRRTHPFYAKFDAEGYTPTWWKAPVA